MITRGAALRGLASGTPPISTGYRRLAPGHSGALGLSRQWWSPVPPGIPALAGRRPSGAAGQGPMGLCTMDGGPSLDRAMKLQVPFIQLPLSFDAAVLAAEIEALGDSPWLPHPQGFPGNSMLPLVAVGGDPANESFAGVMAPTPALQQCPYLTQVFARLGATVGRSRLMRLSGHAEVTRHADQGYYWTERVRVHVPIVTQPTVRFECGSAQINMAAGECWIFDTWRQHRVLNDAVQSRVHLVVDTVGGGAFWDLVGRGRPHDGPAAGWTPARIEPGPLAAVFPCEAVNVPVVMTPWELNAHLGLLFGDVLPHPQLAQVRQISMRFARAWQGAWFAHGERQEGWPVYRALLQQFVEEVRGPSQPLMLRNELGWFKVLLVMVARVAISPAESGNSS